MVILDPLTEIGRLDVGSIVNASNVSRTNMVALIGGGERPKFSQNTLVVYDAADSEPVMDITFGSPLRLAVTDSDSFSDNLKWAKSSRLSMTLIPNTGFYLFEGIL